MVERAPVRRPADYSFERLTRLGERPYGPLRHAHIGSGLFLPLRRISRKQIVKRRRPFRPPDLGDRLRLAAREHLAAELRPVEKLLGDLPDRLEPPQTMRERGRHVLRAEAVGL